jgi:hypothetical protein
VIAPGRAATLARMAGSTAERRLGAPEVAIGALGVNGLLAVVDRDGTIVVLSALCLVGLIALRIGGVPRRSLLVLALGLLAVVLMIDYAPLGAGPRVGSATAHLAGGALLAWAISRPVRERLERSGSPRAGQWSAIVLLLYLAIALVWEAGEWAGEALFGANLGYDTLDTILDVVFGLVGAMAGIFVAQKRGRHGPAEPRAAK